MREIEFRGKRKDTGEWVYGSLIVLVLDETICRIADFDGNSILRVHPETVGQYTGLKDKNGVKIFEGDIVSITDDTGYGTVTRISKVSYFEGMFVLVYDKRSMTIHSCLHDAYSLEVIGNIHDNWELVEKEQP